MSRYESLAGRVFDLGQLSEVEQLAYECLREHYDASPDWEEFSSIWQKEVARAQPKLSSRERVKSALYKIAQDLELRLGVAQGRVAPPDYRDVLISKIEEKFGSRYRFCQETGISQAVLSQVLSGKKNFSIAKLRELAAVLDMGVALLPLEELAELPLRDLGSWRRVSGIIDGELAALSTVHDHLSRIKDTRKRITALKKERTLYPSVLNQLLEQLSERPEETRGEAVLDLIDQEIRRLRPLLGFFRQRIAQAAEPETGEKTYVPSSLPRV